VPGIDGAKMSKSYGNTIELFLPENALRKKVMAIKTDSTPVDQPKPVENSTILALYRLVASDADYSEMRDSFLNGGTGYGQYKNQLFEAIRDYFAPMRKRREEFLQNLDTLHRILAEGAERARAAAEKVMKRVREATGL
jgi:tryptophanyl-tRNA synthetase